VDSRVERKGWRTGQEAVMNRDLWQRLEESRRPAQCKWTWTKGHASHAITTGPTNWRPPRPGIKSFSQGYQPDAHAPCYDLGATPPDEADDLFGGGVQ